MEKKKITELVEFLLLTSLVFVWGGASGSVFAGRINFIDEGQYLAWIQHMLSGGEMYKDIYITYGPLHVYPLYLLSRVFEPSIWLGRFFFTISTLTGIFFALKIMEKLEISRILRYLGIIILILLSAIQLRQSIGLVYLYVFILLIEKYTYWKIVLLGVISVLVFLVSPDIGLITQVLSFCYFATLFIKEKSIISSFRKLIGYVLGWLFILIPFSLWATSEGWFTSYITNTLDVLSSFSGINLPNGKNFPNPGILNPFLGIQFFKNIFSQAILLYLGLIVYSIAFMFSLIQLVRKQSFINISFIVLTSFGFLLYQVVISRSGIGHLFFVISPLIIILFYFLDRLLKYITNSKSDTDKLLAVSLCLLIILFCTRLIKINFPAIRTNVVNLTKLSYTQVDRVGPLRIPKDQALYASKLIRYTRNHSQSSDKIFILSNEPALYFLIKRDNPTRYDLPYIATTRDKRLEMLNDLQHEPPKLILENVEDWPVDEVGNRRRLPEIVQFINQNYKVVTTIGPTKIYKRK